MNRAELVSEVRSKVGLTKKETQNAIDALTEAVGGAPSKGEKVTLVGFGTFEVVNKKARRGVNPRTKRLSRYQRRRGPSSYQGRL